MRCSGASPSNNSASSPWVRHSDAVSTGTPLLDAATPAPSSRYFVRPCDWRHLPQLRCSESWLTTRVTTPAATLLLLPRFLDDDIVERCLDHCLAHRLCTVTNIQLLLERLAPQAAYKRQLLLDLLADRSNGIGHRSGKEQQVGRWLNRAGLTDWTQNLKVRVDNEGAEVEVDFGWPNVNVALEVSPFFTHGSRAKQERDGHCRRLLAVVRWHIVEALDDDIASERAFANTIVRLRASAQRDQARSRSFRPAGRDEMNEVPAQRLQDRSICPPPCTRMRSPVT